MKKGSKQWEKLKLNFIEKEEEKALKHKKCPNCSKTFNENIVSYKFAPDDGSGRVDGFLEHRIYICRACKKTWLDLRRTLREVDYDIFAGSPPKG